eukprot:jgi/Botrbrau1/19484/Bobra.0714s0002.1
MRIHDNLQHPEGVVVLIGWLGSTEQHMAKYAWWWATNGYEIINVKYFKWALLSATAGRRLVGHYQDILRRKHAELVRGGGPARVVFHCFSNTGWVTLGAFLQEFGGDDCPMKPYISGAIIDSAPQPRVSTRMIAAGALAAMNRGKVDQNGPAMKLWMLGLDLWVQGDRRQQLEQIARDIEERSSFPQLYIYSLVDNVIPYKAVLCTMQTQQKMGRYVEALEFGDSPHVQHLRYHEPIYMETLESFVHGHVETFPLPGQVKAAAARHDFVESDHGDIVMPRSHL